MSVSKSLQGVVKYDADGNPVGITLDGSVYREQSESKIASGGSSLVHLDAIDTDSGQGRLKTTLYTQDGDPVAFGAVSQTVHYEYVKTSGGSENLLVDGSVTPVVFTYDADLTYNISLQEIRFTLVSNSITYGTGYFGATAGPLTNGVLVEIVTNGNAFTVANIKENEELINFSSVGGWSWVVSNKDVTTSALVVGGGVKLYSGSVDKVRVTVRDDIDSAGSYMKCFVKGNLLGV